jgi:hypothetical protein
MRKILAVVACLGLAGCANLQNAWTVLSSTSVSPAAVNVAVNTFDALEATATNYLRLPRCANGGPIICRSPSATKQIIPAIRSGRYARNNLEQFIAAHPGQLGPQGLYDALMNSVNTLQSIYGQYNVKGN